MLSKSSLKIVSKLCESCVEVFQSCIKVLSEMCQSRVKVVSKMCQSYLKVVSSVVNNVVLNCVSCLRELIELRLIRIFPVLYSVSSKRQLKAHQQIDVVL